LRPTEWIAKATNYLQPAHTLRITNRISLCVGSDVLARTLWFTCSKRETPSGAPHLEMCFSGLASWRELTLLVGSPAPHALSNRLRTMTGQAFEVLLAGHSSTEPSINITDLAMDANSRLGAPQPLVGVSAAECSCLVDFAKRGVPSLRVSKDARPDSQHTNNTARFFAQKPSSCDMPSELGGDHHMNSVEVTQGSRPRRVMFLVGLAATTIRDKESSVSSVPVVLFFALTSHARITNLRA
jgi:hypothetical protein